MDKKQKNKLLIKLEKEITDIINTMDENTNKMTIESKIIEELEKDFKYSRLPKNLLIKNVQQFCEKIENDKKNNQYNFNKTLPFMNKKRLHFELDLNNKNIKTDKLYKMVKLDNKEFIDSMQNLEDLGGFEQIKQSLQELIYLPLKNPDLFEKLHILPPKGILLVGPPGCGKTSLGVALGKEVTHKLECNFLYKSATEITGGISGESENNLRNLFQLAKEKSPTLVFIDEIECIAGNRDFANKDMEKRVVSQLLTCLDMLPKGVFVIAATTRPEALDPALRRSGRIDREFLLSVPDENERLKILQALIKNVPLSSNVLLENISKQTPGYVAADLNSLVREAGLVAVQRIVKSENDTILLCDEDFQKAILTIQPSAKREGFTIAPDVSFDDIGALDHLKRELHHQILLPILEPEKFSHFQIDSPAGILLYGPPGCGKTLLAKAIANAAQANFIAIKGPELLNKYVGESEKAVRQLFNRAKFAAPCIIFFDELDAICPKRGLESGNAVSERVVNQLLTELDGCLSRGKVSVIAATNRPDILDPAMLRPGRLDKILYVPIPTNEERFLILKAQTRKMPIDSTVNLENISFKKELEGFSGADIAALAKEAALTALLSGKQSIFSEDFEKALKKIVPSLSEKDVKEYEKIEKNIKFSKRKIN